MLSITIYVTFLLRICTYILLLKHNVLQFEFKISIITLLLIRKVQSLKKYKLETLPVAFLIIVYLFTLVGRPVARWVESRTVLNNARDLMRFEATVQSQKAERVLHILYYILCLC